MKKLEKDTATWKARFENCNKALLDMIEEVRKFFPLLIFPRLVNTFILGKQLCPNSTNKYL